ncbi:MAG: hypothetical protein K2Q32_09070 [Alphaproteobacteria bacterium]|nr:hypothetical protein [Alphaproteobacteria bacterium]
MEKQPKRFMAASVPRSLRQQRLGHIPFSCVIGSKHQRGKDGGNLVFDIIMLPEPEFVRMKSNVGIRQVVGPAFKADASFQPGFVMQDTRTVVAPADAIDQEAYAKHHFIKEFGLEEWAEGAPVPKSKPPSPVAKDAVDVDYTVVGYDETKDKQNIKDEFADGSKPFGKK